MMSGSNGPKKGGIMAAFTDEPAINSFEADPTSLDTPGDVKFSWETENANSVSITSKKGTYTSGKLPPNGDTTHNTLQTDTYTLTAVGDEGTVESDPITVKVGGWKK